MDSRSGLKEPGYFGPVLDAFLCAVPHTYREVQADAGSSVVVELMGEAVGFWSLMRENRVWVLYSCTAESPKALVRMDQDLAWRLFTKGLKSDAIAEAVTIEGDLILGQKLLETISIIG